VSASQLALKKNIGWNILKPAEKAIKTTTGENRVDRNPGNTTIQSGLSLSRPSAGGVKSAERFERLLHRLFVLLPFLLCPLFFLSSFSFVVLLGWHPTDSVSMTRDMVLHAAGTLWIIKCPL
jgi:hypothetical protein